MNLVVGIIIGLIVLTLLVVLHEGGHFVMSRKNGVRVKEFGVGFPPRAVAWIKGSDGKWHHFPKKDWEKDSFEYCKKFSKNPKDAKPADSLESSSALIEPGLVLSINWLPIGGFCSMNGESDADTKPGTFGAATFWGKTKILFGGVLMNWLTAVVVFTVLAWAGLPHYVNGQFYMTSDVSIETHPVEISEVVEGSPADQGGFKTGDLISAATAGEETVEITSSFDLTEFNSAHATETVSYSVTAAEDGKPVNRYVTLNSNDAEYLLGVSMHSTGQTLYRSTWSAPIVGVVTTFQLTGETFKGLGAMIGNFFSGIARQLSPNSEIREEGQAALKEAGDSVSGPVGILGTLFPAYVSAGPTNLAFLTALISVSLACMNVLPIPALDGGRWLLIAIFRLRNKKLTTETETRIVSRAFLVLLAFAALITILDIIRIAS